MTIDISTSEMMLRLAAGAVAGAILGFDRSENDRPAGLRTTMLVCLAGTGSMVLANILLPTSGKWADGFGAMDVMRLPLGILTGVGFIGAGAILHKSNYVVGVTTAATLWFATVTGLAIGGGALTLGAALVTLGMCILSLLKFVEKRMHRFRTAELLLEFEGDGPAPEEFVEKLEDAKLHVLRLVFAASATKRKYRCEVKWSDRSDSVLPPPVIQNLAAAPEVKDLTWTPR
jgi:putative Mg2+ transporter-C (MgtC) family protein